ncbi:MAG: ABC transporter ATP-binding protein [Melioribacteraceae bacterium]|nr:ABC transporter ATP-binding protein [Melioribacteraceae bacterium]
MSLTNSYNIRTEKLVKYFGRRLIFNDLNLEFDSGNIYGVSGPNGSGKSTFVKIISDLISPTRGKVLHILNDKKIVSENIHTHLGFVSPYLFLYDEFTAEENISHFAKIRGVETYKEYTDQLFNDFGLFERKGDLVKGYSSGMKQRLKFIFALFHNPQLLIFDEPTSNLDNSGKDIVYRKITEAGKNCLVIVASNEENDLALCSTIIDLEKYKKINSTK